MKLFYFLKKKLAFLLSLELQLTSYFFWGVIVFAFTIRAYILLPLMLRILYVARNYEMYALMAITLIFFRCFLLHNFFSYLYFFHIRYRQLTMNSCSFCSRFSSSNFSFARARDYTISNIIIYVYYNILLYKNFYLFNILYIFNKYYCIFKYTVVFLLINYNIITLFISGIKPTFLKAFFINIFTIILSFFFQFFPNRKRLTYKSNKPFLYTIYLYKNNLTIFCTTLLKLLIVAITISVLLFSLYLFVIIILYLLTKNFIFVHIPIVLLKSTIFIIWTYSTIFLDSVSSFINFDLFSLRADYQAFVAKHDEDAHALWMTDFYEFLNILDLQDHFPGRYRDTASYLLGLLSWGVHSVYDSVESFFYSYIFLPHNYTNLKLLPYLGKIQHLPAGNAYFSTLSSYLISEFDYHRAEYIDGRAAMSALFDTWNLSSLNSFFLTTYYENILFWLLDVATIIYPLHSFLLIFLPQSLLPPLLNSSVQLTFPAAPFFDFTWNLSLQLGGDAFFWVSYFFYSSVSWATPYFFTLAALPISFSEFLDTLPIYISFFFESFQFLLFFLLLFLKLSFDSVFLFFLSLYTWWFLLLMGALLDSLTYFLPYLFLLDFWLRTTLTIFNFHLPSPFGNALAYLHFHLPFLFDFLRFYLLFFLSLLYIPFSFLITLFLYSLSLICYYLITLPISVLFDLPSPFLAPLLDFCFFFIQTLVPVLFDYFAFSYIFSSLLHLLSSSILWFSLLRTDLFFFTYSLDSPLWCATFYYYLLASLFWAFLTIDLKSFVRHSSPCTHNNLPVTSDLIFPSKYRSLLKRLAPQERQLFFMEETLAFIRLHNIDPRVFTALYTAPRLLFSYEPPSSSFSQFSFYLSSSTFCLLRYVRGLLIARFLAQPAPSFPSAALRFPLVFCTSPTLLISSFMLRLRASWQMPLISHHAPAPVTFRIGSITTFSFFITLPWFYLASTFDALHWINRGLLVDLQLMELAAKTFTSTDFYPLGGCGSRYTFNGRFLRDFQSFNLAFTDDFFSTRSQLARLFYLPSAPPKSFKTHYSAVIPSHMNTKLSRLSSSSDLSRVPKRQKKAKDMYFGATGWRRFNYSAYKTLLVTPSYAASINTVELPWQPRPIRRWRDPYQSLPFSAFTIYRSIIGYHTWNMLYFAALFNPNRYHALSKGKGAIIDLFRLRPDPDTGLDRHPYAGFNLSLSNIMKYYRAWFDSFVFPELLDLWVSGARKASRAVEADVIFTPLFTKHFSKDGLRSAKGYQPENEFAAKYRRFIREKHLIAEPMSPMVFYYRNAYFNRYPFFRRPYHFQHRFPVQDDILFRDPVGHEHVNLMVNRWPYHFHTYAFFELMSDFPLLVSEFDHLPSYLTARPASLTNHKPAIAGPDHSKKHRLQALQIAQSQADYPFILERSFDVAGTSFLMRDPFNNLFPNSFYEALISDRKGVWHPTQSFLDFFNRQYYVQYYSLRKPYAFWYLHNERLQFFKKRKRHGADTFLEWSDRSNPTPAARDPLNAYWREKFNIDIALLFRTFYNGWRWPSAPTPTPYLPFDSLFLSPSDVIFDGFLSHFFSRAFDRLFGLFWDLYVNNFYRLYSVFRGGFEPYFPAHFYTNLAAQANFLDFVSSSSVFSAHFLPLPCSPIDEPFIISTLFPLPEELAHSLPFSQLRFFLFDMPYPHFLSDFSAMQKHHCSDYFEDNFDLSVGELRSLGLRTYFLYRKLNCQIYSYASLYDLIITEAVYFPPSSSPLISSPLQDFAMTCVFPLSFFSPLRTWSDLRPLPPLTPFLLFLPPDFFHPKPIAFPEAPPVSFPKPEGLGLKEQLVIFLIETAIKAALR